MSNSRLLTASGVMCVAAAAGLWYMKRKRTSIDYDDKTSTTSIEIDVGLVHKIESQLDWAEYSDDVLEEIAHSKVVALDCEWVSSPLAQEARAGPSTARNDSAETKRKVALLQLAPSQSCVVLVRLCKLWSVPEALAEILADPSIIKVGVGVLDKAAKLQADYRVEVNGCLDLRYMALSTPFVRRRLLTAAREVAFACTNFSMTVETRAQSGFFGTNGSQERDAQADPAALDAFSSLSQLNTSNHTHTDLHLGEKRKYNNDYVIDEKFLSLSSLCWLVLGITVDKCGSREAQTLDWECEEEFTQDHISSACIDVVCSMMLTKEIARSNSGVMWALGWLLPPYLWLESYLFVQYAEFIGRPFRQLRRNFLTALCPGLEQREPKRKPEVRTEGLDRQVSKRRVGRSQAVPSYSIRRRPLYGNCKILCPDGELLCTCDERKIRWYIARGLAELVSNDELDTKNSVFQSERENNQGMYSTPLGGRNDEPQPKIPVETTRQPEKECGLATPSKSFRRYTQRRQTQEGDQQHPSLSVKQAQHNERPVGQQESLPKPLTARLCFEPSQRTILDGHYYTAPKENVCVVCGSRNDLVRKCVVPREYRRHFPKIMKHHNAHDVLLTCVRCHRQSGLYDDELRDRLAAMCDAPLWSSARKYVQVDKLREIRLAANALLKERVHRQYLGDAGSTATTGWGVLPAARRAELEQRVSDHFGVQRIDERLLREAAQLDSRTLNGTYMSHGEKVVRWFAGDSDETDAGQGLIKLETMWRQHFLDRMAPRHLPAMWSVDHHHQVLAVKVAFIRDSHPNEALRLMRRLGLSDRDIDEVFAKLEDDERVKVEKMSIKKGRLIESLAD